MEEGTTGTQPTDSPTGELSALSCSAHVVLRMLGVRRMQRMVGGVRMLLLATFVVMTMMVMAVLTMFVLV